jgi:hypothetical protein
LGGGKILTKPAVEQAQNLAELGEDGFEVGGSAPQHTSGVLGTKV